jgi:Protein of unknown function (DUF4232)
VKFVAAVAAAVLSVLVLAGPANPEPALGTCRTAQLHVWVTRTGAALGTVGGYLAFTNRGTACTLRGWPTVTAVGPGISATAIHVHATMFGPYVHGTGKYITGTPLVRLRQGQTGVAALTTSDAPSQGQTRCPPSFRGLRVTPPSNTASVEISSWLAYYGQELPSCTGIELSMTVPASDMPPRG